MNILITGGAGFIGSHLSQYLLEHGHSVQIIDDLSTGSLKNIEHLVSNPRFHFATETILNKTVMGRLVSECDIIFHLAAAVGVRLIIDRPVHTIETNIMGTEIVLRAAQRYRKKVFIASSSEIYGKSNSDTLREDDDCVLGPTTKSRWSYACSKAIDEFLGLAYYREYNLPVIIGRFFNVAGPRQTGRYGMVVPRFVEQALAGTAITVYGDGHQSRCFGYVKDVVKATVALVETEQAVGQIYNIGSEEEITINALAEKVKERTSSSSEIVHIPYTEAYEMGFEDLRRRVPDTSRLQATIGFKLETKLDTIIDKIVESCP